MTIHVSISDESIEMAIMKLIDVMDNLDDGVWDVVSILTNEGAEIANAAYGGMAGATGTADGNFGQISTTGENAVIAEFGAGQATMPVMFENSPSTPVYEGSYSELVGSQEYYRFGSWHFGGRYYTEVPARHGLLDAKHFIIANSTAIALGAIKL